MAHSTIPSLKTNLVAGLQARAALTGVQVSYGPPLPNPGREFIWVGRASGEQTYATVGGKVKEETYDLEVLISVVREGQDSAAADARCFTIYAELEDMVRTDKTVAGAVLQASIGPFELTEAVSSDQRESALTVQVACMAFI